MACLKPVLGEEVSLVSELQQLEEVCVKLDKHTEDPFKLPEASEQVITWLWPFQHRFVVKASHHQLASPSPKLTLGSDRH